MGKKVAVHLSSTYWTLAQDSVVLAETITLPIIPDGSLSTLTGNVKSKTDPPLDLDGVSITIDNGTPIQADKRGNFTINLPYHLQKKMYMLSVNRAGYEPWHDYYFPRSGNIDIRLTRLKKPVR